ncbi:MAG: flagellar FliJ family protein [Acutalibacteraceae bacterium]
MKKFIFSLEKVLNVKQQMLEVKKGEIAQVNTKIKEIENEEERVKLEFHDYDTKMRLELERGTSPQNVMTYKVYFNSLIKKEKELAKEKEVQKEILKQKREELILLNSEILGIEKLEEKQRAEYEKEARKTQERNIEEYINQISATQ